MPYASAEKKAAWRAAKRQPCPDCGQPAMPGRRCWSCAARLRWASRRGRQWDSEAQRRAFTGPMHGRATAKTQTQKAHPTGHPCAHCHRKPARGDAYCSTECARAAHGVVQRLDGWGKGAGNRGNASDWVRPYRHSVLDGPSPRDNPSVQEALECLESGQLVPALRIDEAVEVLSE